MTIKCRMKLSDDSMRQACSWKPKASKYGMAYKVATLRHSQCVDFISLHHKYVLALAIANRANPNHSILASEALATDVAILLFRNGNF